MPDTHYAVSFFETDLGWIAMGGQKKQVTHLTFGHRTEEMARKDFLRRSPEIAWTETDWNPKARKILIEYAAGRSRDLAKIDVAFHASTEFQRKVLMIVRGLDYGETASYGEIAERAGAPGAARAVGTVMSTNRIPLLIPCHRVTAAGGKLGGYTARDGVNMKERLLKMERSRGGA